MSNVPVTLAEYELAIGPAINRDHEDAEDLVPGSVEILRQYREGLLTDSETVALILGQIAVGWETSA